MTEILIFSLSLIVWLAKGHYDPSVIVLLFIFFAWIYSVFKNTDHKFNFPHFNWVLPLLMSLMLAYRTNLLYVDDEYRVLYSFYRFVPFLLVMYYFKLIRSNHTPNLEKKLNGILILFSVYFLTVLWLSPRPIIDVFTSNTEGVRYLLSGLNPYSQKYAQVRQ